MDRRQEVKCPDIQIHSTFEHGTRTCSGKPYNVFGNTCVHLCATGYTLEGPVKTTCQPSGQWTSLARCDALFCASLVTPANGLLPTCTGGIADNAYNSRCTFSCNQGYEISGANSLTCRGTTKQTMAWSDKLPSCKRVQCPKLLVKTSTVYSCDNGNLYQSTCIIACRLGHSFEDQSLGDSVVCQHTKTWSIASSCNKVTCPDISSLGIDNGVGNCTGDYPLFGSHCIYSCEVGYTLVGPSKIQCQADQTWTRQPRCDINHCPLIQRPLHGTLTCDSDDFTAYGTVCGFSCDKGYNMTQIPKTMSHVTCLANGKWNGNAPSCEIIHCGEPPVLDNGKWVCLNETYASKCRLTCHKGFVIPHSVSHYEGISCLHTGEWTTTKLLCKEALAPLMTGCPGNTTMTVLEAFVSVTIPKPKFTTHDGSILDNDCGAFQSQNIQLDFGNYLVHCVGKNEELNTETTCTYMLTIEEAKCPVLPNPENGAIACIDLPATSLCSVLCSADHPRISREFHKQAMNYLCIRGQNQSLAWFPEPNIPACLASNRRTVALDNGMTYTDTCGQQNDIATVYITHLMDTIWSTQCEADKTLCSTENVQVIC